MGADMLTTRLVVITIAMVALCSQTGAADQKAWDESFKPLKGEYLLYSGSLNESQKPTRTDRKVAFKVSGPAARDLFESMYPDEKITCTSMKRYRERRKGEIFCTFFPQDGYACYFGFDLRTGKSIGGASC